MLNRYRQNPCKIAYGDGILPPESCSYGQRSKCADLAELLPVFPFFSYILNQLVNSHAHKIQHYDNAEKIQRLFLIGTILTFAGFLLSYGCPINKKVWSPTFVIITCGLASSFLALLIWIIDMKGYQNWCAFFRSFGVNPLFIYVFAETMGIALGATGVSAFIYEKMLAPALGDYPGSLVYALIYIIFCWSIVHILYKKGIYIKI